MPLLLLAPLSAGCLDAMMDDSPAFERQIERTFKIEPGSLVTVSLSGSSLTAETGPPGTVTWLLRQTVYADSEDRIPDALADYDIVAAQDGDTVQLVARRRQGLRSSWGSNRVRFSATVRLPPDVRLHVGTSGGSIRVHGERAASLQADTSGGSIRVDGGSGDMDVETSGGSITVGRALGALHAETSGGSITVDYVGTGARTVSLDTSGGGIRVNVDPAATLEITADTSGGSVRVEDLSLSIRSQERSHLRGLLNGGGGSLSARTSGGSIRIGAARD
jgi:hypothetical protein